MSDIATALTDSLSRTGQGGMQVPFKNADGSVVAPGMSWTNESNTGFYRNGVSDMRVSVAGGDKMRWTSTATQLWNGTAWSNVQTALDLAGYAKKAVDETITAKWNFSYKQLPNGYGVVFDGYTQFKDGAEFASYVEVANPVGFPTDFTLIGFWDYNAAVNEKSWKIEQDRSDKSFYIATGADSGGTNRKHLEFKRGTGQAVTSITYGNQTDMPTHDFYGAGQFFGDALDVSGPVFGGLYIGHDAAAANEQWWGFATANGPLEIGTVLDAGGGGKLVFRATRSGTAITGIAIGNTTDLAPVVVNGALNVTGAITQAGTGVVLSTRAINTTNSLTGGGSLAADRTLQLVNDAAAPGSSFYYGTSAGGVKGFFPLSGVVGVPEAPVDGNIYGRQNASWANLGGAGLYVLKAGDTMTGKLTLSGTHPQIEIANASSGSMIYNSTGAAADNRVWRTLGGGTTFGISAMPDTMASEKLAMQFARSGTAVTAVTLGNSVDLPPLRAYATLASFGTNNYTPAATSSYAAGVGGGATGRCEVGVSTAGGTNNPRTCLFADQASGVVGLDWTFSTGGTKFSFRRGGAEIAYYDANAFSIPLGLPLRYYGPNATTFGHIYRTASQLVVTDPAGLHLLVGGGGVSQIVVSAAAIDLKQPVTATSTLEVTGAATFSALATANVGVSIRSANALALLNAANTVTRSLKVSTADEIIVDTRGAVWGWDANTLLRGRISISTTEPVGNDVTKAGNIVLVYE
jgi:hypothetical protein